MSNFHAPHDEDDVIIEHASIPGMPADARQMLTKMCQMYNYTLSDMEAFLWSTQILDVYSDMQIIKALMAHIEGPAPARSFFPKYGDIKALLEPVRGVSELERLVRLGNPYHAPRIDDPVLLQAIGIMGGWQQMCAQMPDPRERSIDFSQYCKRLESALAQAQKEIRVEGASPPLLKGLADAQKPNQLAIEHQSKPGAVPALSAPEVEEQRPLKGVFSDFARRSIKSQG